jgi:hypothetical protein
VSNTCESTAAAAGDNNNQSEHTESHSTDETYHENYELRPVHTVTAADVAAGTYSVFDVVLPLPAKLVTYPAHKTGTNTYKCIIYLYTYIKCNAYTIFDVVLPLPAKLVTYPAHKTGT